MTAAIRRYTLTPVATTTIDSGHGIGSAIDNRSGNQSGNGSADLSHGSSFADFKPYVPSIRDDGLICFQARLRDGRTGVFTANGEAVTQIGVTGTPTCPLAAFTSHPDLNSAGDVTVYARQSSGEEVLALCKAGGRWETTGADRQLYRIGPLGPTMNERGDVAFRATTHLGTASLQLCRDRQILTVAEADERFSGFAGLPVVNGRGDVTFRASLRDGREGVFVRQLDGPCLEVAATGGDFDDIAPFPTMNDRGDVAFVARPRGSPGWSVFIATAGGLNRWIGPDPAFESYRGLLLNNAGPVVFYGTPAGGQLGIYCGTDAVHHRILGLGDPLLGSTVTDFALNPVSVNEAGQIAVRVALKNGQQWVLRGDPT